MTTRQQGELARFAVKANDIGNTDAQTAKRMFRPNKLGELSVSRIEGLDCNGIILEGQGVVEGRDDTDTLYGWIEVHEQVVQGQGLRIDYDEEPSRHANIVAWGEIPGDRQQQRLELVRQCSRSPVKLDPPRLFAERPSQG